MPTVNAWGFVQNFTAVAYLSHSKSSLTVVCDLYVYNYICIFVRVCQLWVWLHWDHCSAGCLLWGCSPLHFFLVIFSFDHFYSVTLYDQIRGCPKCSQKQPWVQFCWLSVLGQLNWHTLTNLVHFSTLNSWNDIFNYNYIILVSNIFVRDRFDSKFASFNKCVVAWF